MTSETEPIDDLKEGLDFLAERGMIAPTAELEGGVVYGLTEDGLRALYMLSMLVASGDDTNHDADARQITQCAAALVKAIDELGA